MSDPTVYPNVDPVLSEYIKSIHILPQVQYGTKDQLLYLIDIANKLGLYDAADILKHLTGNK